MVYYSLLLIVLLAFVLIIQHCCTSLHCTALTSPLHLTGGIIVLAACTDITVLDDALLRPGRLEHHIRLDLPNRSDIKDILAARLKKLTCSDDVCVDDLADILISKLDSQVTGADVENVCRRALMSRIREHLALECSSLGNRESEKDIKIGNKNFLEALEEVYPSVSDCLLQPEDGRSKCKSEAVPFEWTGAFSGGISLNPG
jgi:SpoVK/Ycf46/Vps4 family AAA+-type ATPase